VEHRHHRQQVVSGFIGITEPFDAIIEWMIVERCE
jgi:hypothetical protein